MSTSAPNTILYHAFFTFQHLCFLGLGVVVSTGKIDSLEPVSEIPQWGLVSNDAPIACKGGEHDTTLGWLTTKLNFKMGISNNEKDIETFPTTWFECNPHLRIHVLGLRVPTWSNKSSSYKSMTHFNFLIEMKSSYVRNMYSLSFSSLVKST